MKKAVLIASVIIFGLASLSWSQERNFPRLISVAGEAEIKVVPDEVVIVLGVETSNKILIKAKNENDKALRAIIAVVEKYGVDRKNAQTDYFTIEPTYEEVLVSNVYRNVFAGYFVRKNIVITLNDLSKYEDVLSGVLEAGANYVQGIQFLTTNLRKYRDQARETAIEAAKEKAESMAGKLGITIGRAYSINEESGSWYYGNNYWQNSRTFRQTQNVQQVQNAASYSENNNYTSEGSTISPGQISITARVSVSFELE
jgi:hypothetical protein